MPRSSLLNVPYTGTREVETTSAPVVWQDIRVNEDMFGAQKGRALQQLGSAIGKFGEAIGSQMDKNQAEADNNAARSIDTEAMKKYTQETAAYTLMNGEEATKNSDAHEARLLEIKEEAIKAAGGNKSVERMVRAGIEGQYRRAWSTAFSHKTRQTIVHGDEISENRIKAQEQKALVTRDEDELRGAVGVLEAEQSEIARRNRWSEERLLNTINERRSKMYTGFIGNMAIHHPGSARAYFNKYKPLMNEAGRDVAEQAITKGYAGIGAVEPTEQVIRGESPTIELRRPLEGEPRAPVGPGPSRFPGPGTIAPRGTPAPGTPLPRERPERLGEAEGEPQRVQMASLISGTMSDAPQPGAQRLAQAQKVEQPQGFKGGSKIPQNFQGIPTIDQIPDDWSSIHAYGPNNKYKTPMDVLKNVPDTHEAFILNRPDATDSTGAPGGIYGSTEEEGTIVVRPRPGPKPEDLISGKDKPTRVAQAGDTEFSSQSRGYTPENKPARPIAGYAPEADSATVERYIVQAAKLRGIDPGTAIAVYQSEGSTNWKSTVPGENSWGPYQLFTGPALEGNSGLGNAFYRETGKDPSNPNTWRENVDFALNKVVEGGWGPWNGAKKIGITGKVGVANDARVIPVGGKAPAEVLPEGELDEEPKTPLQQRTLKGYVAEKQAGDPNAVARPGSRVIHAYNVPGRIRAIPPDPQLEKATDEAANAAGVKIRITSAGQTSDRNPAMRDRPGGWTGSHRHDGGRAADVDILDDDGKVLSRNDPKRLKFLEEAAARGVGGTGAGYMDDSLKVHIGITGSSGKVGVGLGAYAGNAEERAAVQRGLERGGYDASTRFAQRGEGGGGRVQVASLSSGTMSDAPAPESAAVTRYAQATSSDGHPGTTAQAALKAIDADTPDFEVNKILNQIRDQARAGGHDSSHAEAIAKGVLARHAAMKAEKIEKHALANKTIENAVFGKDGNGEHTIKDRNQIAKDAKLMEQWNLLTNKEKDRYEDQIIKNNSVGDKRISTNEDLRAFETLQGQAMLNPEIVRGLNPGDWPRDMRARVIKFRDDMLKPGGNAELKEVNNILKTQSIEGMLRSAGITEKGSPTRWGGVAAALAGELRIWRETPGNASKPLTQEVTRKMVKDILLYGEGGFFSKPRVFEIEPSKKEQEVLVQSWNASRPDDKVEKWSDIPASARWYWRRNQEEAAKRNAATRYQTWP